MRRIAGYISMITSVVTLALSGCFIGQPKEEVATRAVVVDKNGVWMNHQLTGYVSQPLYPLPLTTRPFDTAFAVHLEKPFAAPGGSQQLFARLFNSTTPAGLNAVCLSRPNTYDGNPLFPVLNPTNTLYIWQIAGCYTAGSGTYVSGTAGIDYALVTTDLAIDPTCPNSLGVCGGANLTWKYNTTSGIVLGSPASHVDDYVWVQASPTVPAPVTYAWKLGGVTLPGFSGSFVDTAFSAQGNKSFSVTMTGSNGAQQSGTFLIRINANCPPPQISC